MAPRRILIADDDVDALRLVGMMLERQGYQILAAANGQQALQKAVEAQPALVILDVMMPDMDGYEVASRLRRHPATDDIPILMFTAKAAVNDRIAGFQAGADDYLTKPVHPRELVSRVEALLQRKARTSDLPEEHGTLVAFLPSKGGLGTSTLTLNSALELRRMRREAKSALVELQEGTGTIGLQLGLDTPQGNHHGLSALAERPLSQVTREQLRAYMVQHSSGLHLLLAAQEPPGVGTGLDKGYVRTILRYLIAEYNYVILDLPGRLDDSCQEALRLCRRIFVTVEPNRIGLELARKALAALEHLDMGIEKTRLVLLHRVPASGTISRTTIEQTLNVEMVAGIPPAPDLAFQSNQNGKPLVEMQPHGLVTQQIRRVVQAILEA